MDLKHKKQYTKWFLDLETTNFEQYKKDGHTKAYLIYIKNYDTDEDLMGVDLEDTMNKFVSNLKGKHILYAHNGGGFDWWFFQNWLLKKYKYVERIEKNNPLQKNVFSVLITKQNKIFQMQVKTDKATIYFNDTLLLFPQISVKKMGDIIGIEKLDYDVKKFHYEKSVDEIHPKVKEYIKRDVEIPIKFFKHLEKSVEDFDLDKNAITLSMSAYQLWMKTAYKIIAKECGVSEKYGWYNWETLFPHKSFNNEDWDYMHAMYYNGGLCTINKKWENKIINQPVKQYDVNSLYPYIMKDRPLPYGLPLPFIKWKNLSNKELMKKYFVLFKVKLNDRHLVKDCVPFLGKRMFSKFGSLLYEVSKEKEQNLYIPSPLINLFLKHYPPVNGQLPELIPEFVFATKTGMFNEYIDTNLKGKIDSKEKGDVAMTSYYKLMLNSLYGKFGQKRLMESKIYKDGVLITNDEPNPSIYKKYLPIAIAITSYAREMLLDAITSNWEKFIYCDTDSIHLLDDGKPPKNLKFHQTKLGYWSDEWEGHKVSMGFYNAPKRYGVMLDGKPHWKIAGLNNQEWKDKTNLIKGKEMFDEGFKVKNAALSRAIVEGGVVLKEIDKVFKTNISLFEMEIPK